jgi:hypothetical protein
VRGLPAGQERWVIELELEIPADVAHEQESQDLSGRLLKRLEADPDFGDWGRRRYGSAVIGAGRGELTDA